MSVVDPAELDRLVLDSAVEANILPLTSRCDSHCVFCSHKNNPPSVRTLSVGTRSLDDVARTMAFLDPRRVITIGESATPIIDGEPFLHPRFRDIISLVRKAYPRTPLEITTNGRRLSPRMVDFLAEVGDIYLHISLNSASARGRELLMGDTPAESQRTFSGVRRLRESGIRFSGSLVAMPHLTGWDDVGGTVAFLGETGAEVIRVVMPAFSAWAVPDLLSDASGPYQQLRDFVDTTAAGSPCPVLIEPSCVSDLVPVVSGVLRSSAAWQAGMRRGDIVVAINGTTPRCRVEAWKMLLEAGDVRIRVDRDGESVEMEWADKPGGDPGVTMEYDFDPDRTEWLGETIGSCPGRSLLLVSELGQGVVRAALASLRVGRDRAEVGVVPNRTFGGTIGAAGLLTVADYREAYAARVEAERDPAQVIVPVESFDRRGFDLTGAHVSALAQAWGVPVLSG